MSSETPESEQVETRAPFALVVHGAVSDRKFRVRVIGTGFGANFENGAQWYVPDTDAGIGSARKTFGGARVHWHKVGEKFDHVDKQFADWIGTDHDIGYLSDLAVADGGLEATLNVDDDVPAEIAEVIASRKVGLSIEAYADRRPAIEGGKKVVHLVNFRHGAQPASVALVSDPALRGEILRVAASRHQAQEIADMAEANKDAPVVPDVSDQIEAINAAQKQAAEAVHAMKVMAATQALDAALFASALPEKARSLVRASVCSYAERGENVPADVLTKHIDEARDLIKGDAKVNAGASVQVGAGPEDKIALRLETLLGRNDPEWARKSYDRRFHGGETLAQRRVKAGLDGHGHEGSFLRLFRDSTSHEFTDLGRRETSQSVKASIQTSTFGDAFDNVLNRRMLAYYENPNFADWRKVASISTVPNFVKQERIVMGGYANLATVSEGANYGAFTSPGDEGHGYTPTKRGGTESITREAILRDDVGALARIPASIGVSAARTLYEFVFDLYTIAGQPTMDYDSTTLYHADHDNLTTSSNALAADKLIAAIKAMMKQADISSSKRMMVMPRKLLVPIDLANTAFDLLKPLATYPGGATTDNEWLRGYGMEAIIARHWTNTGDWFLTADPSEFPTAEVGFVLGQEEPELFTQDNATIGSLFDADKIVIKCRHEYGGTIVRHEGVYGNDV